MVKIDLKRWLDSVRAWYRRDSSKISIDVQSDWRRIIITSLSILGLLLVLSIWVDIYIMRIGERVNQGDISHDFQVVDLTSLNKAVQVISERQNSFQNLGGAKRLITDPSL